MVNQVLSSLYNKNAEQILNHYNELVDHTRNLIFPSWEFNIIEAPNLHGLSKARTVIAKALAPYPLPGEAFSTSYFIWLFIFLAWIAVIVAYGNLSSQSATSNAGAESNPMSIWEIIVGLIFFVLPPLLMYSYTLWFLIAKRISLKTRLAWLISFLLLFLLCMYQIQQLTSNGIATIVKPPFFQFLLFLMIIPAFLFIIFNLIFMGKSLIEFIHNAFNSFLFAHQAVSYKFLRQITTSPIKSKTADWHLLGLDLEEIGSLKELAKGNLEATEKKLYLL